MSFYIFIGLLIITFNLYKKGLSLLLISILLIIYSGLRGGIAGVDYESYRQIYETGYFPGTEPVFSYIVTIHKNTFDSYSAFIFTCALASIGLKLIVIRRLADSEWFGLFLYVCIIYPYIEFGFIRQSLAISVFAIALYLLREKRKVYSVAAYVISLLIHNSLVFMAFVYFLNQKPINSSEWIVKLTVVFFLVALFPYFQHVEQLIDLSINLNFPATFSWKAIHYLRHDDYRSEVLNPYLLRFMVVACILHIYSRRLQDEVVLMKAYFFGIFLMLLFSFNVQFYTRISMPLLFIEIILISKLSLVLRGWNQVIMNLFFIIFYTAFFYKTVVLFDIKEVLPF